MAVAFDANQVEGQANVTNNITRDLLCSQDGHNLCLTSNKGLLRLVAEADDF